MSEWLSDGEYCTMCNGSGYMPPDPEDGQELGNRLHDYSFCECIAGQALVARFQQAIVDVQEDLHPKARVKSIWQLPRDEADFKYQAALFLFDCATKPSQKYIERLETTLEQRESTCLTLSAELEAVKEQLANMKNNRGPGNNGMGWDDAKKEESNG
jgi:hypothetical protein